MSFPHTAHIGPPTFKLDLNLNNARYMQRVSNFLEDGHLKNGIAQLNLQSRNKYITLLSFLQRNWKSGITIIFNQASTVQQVSNQCGAEEAEVIMDIANMVILVVGNYKSEHPKEITSEEDRVRYINTATGIVVETFYEAFTGPQGAFSTTLLGPHLRNLVAQTTPKGLVKKTTLQRKRKLDRLQIEYEALHEEKDKKVSELVAARDANLQLRQDVATGQASVRRLEDQNRILTDQIKHAEQETAASEARAMRAKTRADQAEDEARKHHDSSAHFLARAIDAEKLAEDEKRSAERAHLSAAEWEELYFTVLDNQWEAISRMPEELWVRLMPYITLPKADSSVASFIARKDASPDF